MTGKPYIVRTVGASHSLVLTVAPEVIRKLGLKDGDYVRWEGDRIVKMRLVDA